MATPIEIGADLIDSRDVIDRLAELRDLDESDGYELDESEREELAFLAEIESEASGYAADWQYGETLIHERYFLTYAQELAEDIGAIKDDYSWPISHIDWDAACDALKQDYTGFEASGHTYYVR